MNYKQKQKIANDYINITKKFKAANATFRPDYADIVINRILDLFPNDGVEIAILFKDRLVNELNWKLDK